MDLQLATTADIVKELRSRRMRFVMVGVENTNRSEDGPVFLAGQAADPEEMVRLIDIGRHALSGMNADFAPDPDPFDNYGVRPDDPDDLDLGEE